MPVDSVDSRALGGYQDGMEWTSWQRLFISSVDCVSPIHKLQVLYRNLLEYDRRCPLISKSGNTLAPCGPAASVHLMVHVDIVINDYKFQLVNSQTLLE